MPLGPQRAGDCSPAGRAHGADHLEQLADEPSGVQLARPMRPPPAHDAHHFARGARVLRREHRTNVD
jgi:hypothetical protein